MWNCPSLKAVTLLTFHQGFMIPPAGVGKEIFLHFVTLFKKRFAEFMNGTLKGKCALRLLFASHCVLSGLDTRLRQSQKMPMLDICPWAFECSARKALLEAWGKPTAIHSRTPFEEIFRTPLEGIFRIVSGPSKGCAWVRLLAFCMLLSSCVPTRAPWPCWPT